MKKRKCIMKNMETGAEDKNQQTAIYVMTHKAFTPPPDPLYIPLHVGRAAASSYSRDDYCRKLIIYLYKTYFKKEYNQLKRYSKLSMYDVYDLCENESGCQKGSRILLMADFLNIKHDETCSCLSAVIRESMERETRNYEKITDPEPLNEDLYHASAIQVNVWSDQELQRRRKYPFRELRRIPHQNICRTICCGNFLQR